MTQQLWMPTDPAADPKMVLYGWISGSTDEERAELEALGVVLGNVHPSGAFVGCTVSEEAHEALLPLHGRYVWSLGRARQYLKTKPDVASARAHHEQALRDAARPVISDEEVDDGR